MTTQKTRNKNLSAPFSRFGWNPLNDPTCPTPSRYFILHNKRKVVSSKGFDTYEQARQALRKKFRKDFPGAQARQAVWLGGWTSNPNSYTPLGYTIEKR